MIKQRIPTVSPNYVSSLFLNQSRLILFETTNREQNHRVIEYKGKKYFSLAQRKVNKSE